MMERGGGWGNMTHGKGSMAQKNQCELKILAEKRRSGEKVRKEEKKWKEERRWGNREIQV
jgi:hypothetical protein